MANKEIIRQMLNGVRFRSEDGKDYYFSDTLGYFVTDYDKQEDEIIEVYVSHFPDNLTKVETKKYVKPAWECIKGCEKRAFTFNKSRSHYTDNESIYYIMDILHRAKKQYKSEWNLPDWMLEEREA